MLTCKEFLTELNAFLDEETDALLRVQLEKHISECPNCWVVVDTCKKTMKVFKGTEPQPIPREVEGRLLEALRRRMEARRGGEC
ncbi:MAG: zf-HC2 domain-containing protein [Acidobacteriaceae bacterium]|nr:zf-HC2 domain-containing protein [Acidobacteriaceae bacterium]